MQFNEIPLTADNQQFSTILAGVTYQIRIIWREPYWVMDIANSSGAQVVKGVPLVTGADLLAQYAYMGFGFRLAVICDVAGQDYPTQTDLGTGSHLLAITE
ncbi:TPA: phage baseplate plug family protein [Raoultella planticola]